jgi:DNA-binding CsgD family transcriptional regulator
MGNRRPRHRSCLQHAASLLRLVPVGGAPAQLYAALRVCAPVAGGLVGTMGSQMAGSMINHVVGLPDVVLDAWMTTPLDHLRRMMAPLAPAAPGELISDRMQIKGSFRDELALLEVLDAAGLGESAGYKVASRICQSGKQEHRFLTLALEDGEVFTPSQRELFRQLHPFVEEALARMNLPLVAHDSLLPQIVEQDRAGYLCLSSTGAVIELNERAHVLTRRYAEAARVVGRHGTLAGFVEHVLTESRRRRTWSLAHASGTRIQITMYRINKESHAVGQNLTLVTLAEDDPSKALESAGLSPRQCQIALLLAYSGLSYKQMADKLRMSEGTLRKHVEKLYRRLDVHSRAELVERLSRLH